MWLVIGAVFILSGLGLVWSVIGRKFPQLRLIDLSTLAKERHAQVKSRIMKDRFDRSMGRLKSRTGTAAARAKGRIGRAYEKLYRRLKRMEEKYEEESPTPPEAREARNNRLLAEAERLIEEERLEDAEERYIEVLRLDPHSIDAYRGLAEIYISQKAYDQAKEVLEFLLKLDKSDARAFERLGAVERFRGNFREAEARFLESISLAGNVASYRAELAELYLRTGEPEKAWEQLKIALEKEPYNPKYLDYFLEASILVGDAEAASEALEALETANPENQKLEDLRERVEELKKGGSSS